MRAVGTRHRHGVRIGTRNAVRHWRLTGELIAWMNAIGHNADLPRRSHAIHRALQLLRWRRDALSVLPWLLPLLLHRVLVLKANVKDLLHIVQDEYTWV